MNFRFTRPSQSESKKQSGTVGPMSHQRNASVPPKSDSEIADDDKNDDEPTKATSTQSKPQQEEIQTQQQPPHRIVHNIRTLQMPGYFDVLFGRGKPFQQHAGNIRMLTIVERNRERYRTEAKLHKLQVVKEVIDEIRNHNPPVRFLKPAEGDRSGKKRLTLVGPWVKASEEETLKKIAHCLRAQTPKAILSLGKIKDQQQSSLTSIINPMDPPKMMRQSSVARHPQARSNIPTSTDDSLMLPQIAMQLKNPPTSISYKTHDESTTHCRHERRPNHSNEWSGLTTGSQKADLAHQTSPHFPHEAELKLPAMPQNIGGRVGEISEMDQRPVPGQIAGQSLMQNDILRQIPGVASFLTHSEASYNSAAIERGENLPSGDSNNPSVARIEPLNANIEFGGSQSKSQPEEISPVSFGILARTLQAGPSHEPHPFNELINTSTNPGGNISTDRTSKGKLSYLPELDSSMEHPAYHSIRRKDPEGTLDGDEFSVIGDQEIVDVETRTLTFEGRQESKETPQSMAVDSPKIAASTEIDDEDDEDND